MENACLHFQDAWMDIHREFCERKHFFRLILSQQIVAFGEVATNRGLFFVKLKGNDYLCNVVGS